MTWNSTLKWCIRHTDGEDVEINELKRCILIDWNKSTLYSSCALHVSVTGTNFEIVKCLIDHGFSVDSRKTNGTTPIHWACKKGNLSMVKFLLSYNANPNASDYGMCTKNVSPLLKFSYFHILDGNGVLHYASEEGNLEIVKFLIENKIITNINQRNNDGFSPFFLACNNRNINVMKYLSKHGADVLNTAKYCSMNDMSSMIRIIIKYLPFLSFIKEEELNPLHVAIIFEKKKTIKIFIKYCSVLLDYSDSKGVSSKSLLQSHKNPEIKQLIPSNI